MRNKNQASQARMPPEGGRRSAAARGLGAVGAVALGRWNRIAAGSAGRWIGLIALAEALWLGGCAKPLTDEQLNSLRTTQSREARERTLQRVWVGRTRAELVQVFGIPATVMGVPGARVPDSIILVFRGTDPAGHCIDAFVILRDEVETIWNYFCR